MTVTRKVKMKIIAIIDQQILLVLAVQQYLVTQLPSKDCKPTMDNQEVCIHTYTNRSFHGCSICNIIYNVLSLDSTKRIPVKIVIHEVKKSDECPNDKPWKCDF